jgi:hypothetical protein
MRIPVVRGWIDRRILVNYRVRREVIERILPRPFRPVTVDGWAVAGVCLIRLRGMRPPLVPSFLGLSSENAAHRIAVEWDTASGARQGVYIPRRDTSSRLNSLGSRLFAGVYHHARFSVHEEDDRFRVQLQSDDQTTRLLVDTRLGTALPAGALFESLGDASRFFERGALGFSPRNAECSSFDSLELRSFRWKVEPLEVSQVESSFFADESLFPDGTARFDHALLMRRIPHEWRASEPIQADGFVRGRAATE